jgi:hypothetical protein
VGPSFPGDDQLGWAGLMPGLSTREDVRLVPWSSASMDDYLLCIGRLGGMQGKAGFGGRDCRPRSVVSRDSGLDQVGIIRCRRVCCELFEECALISVFISH